jgi:hypothetical protein
MACEAIGMFVWAIGGMVGTDGGSGAGTAPWANDSGTRGIMPAVRNPDGGGMTGWPLGIKVACGERASG